LSLIIVYQIENILDQPAYSGLVWNTSAHTNTKHKCIIMWCVISKTAVTLRLMFAINLFVNLWQDIMHATMSSTALPWDYGPNTKPTKGCIWYLEIRLVHTDNKFSLNLMSKSLFTPNQPIERLHHLLYRCCWHKINRYSSSRMTSFARLIKTLP